MLIESIKRPWQKESLHGNHRRYNRDPFYNSTQWKRTRESFKLGFSMLHNGNKVSNTLCYECASSGKTVTGQAIDHITQIKECGSRTDHNNLMNLCSHHHAVKSANEGNRTK